MECIKIQHLLMKRHRSTYTTLHRLLHQNVKVTQHLRHLSSASLSRELSDQVKPFTTIPGPLKLPILGTLLPYKLGIKKLPTYHQDVCDLFKKYGPVVREAFGSQIIVHVFDPLDIRKVYENDGKMPHIPPLQETTQFYRQQKDMSLGLGNLNGDDWYKLRHAVQQMMLRPKEVSYYYPLQDGVAKEAIAQIQQQIDSRGVVKDLHFLAGKWILESAGMCCFEKSLGSFRGGKKAELAQKLVEANIDIFKLSADLKFSLRLYRFFKTPKYSKLHGIEDFFYGESSKFITETIEEIRHMSEEGTLEEGKFNFLTYLMSRKELSEKDIVTITLSLFSDGLSTTAPTLLGNLHCLALNPDAQERVYQEVLRMVDPSVPITVKTVNKLHYLKAFVKEVFRTTPRPLDYFHRTMKIIYVDKEISPYFSELHAVIYLNHQKMIALKNEELIKCFRMELEESEIEMEVNVSDTNIGTSTHRQNRLKLQESEVLLVIMEKFPMIPILEAKSSVFKYFSQRKYSLASSKFYPIGESVQRLPQKDLNLSGYHVPAGTYVDLNPYVWLRSDEYFKEPHSFRPERWLRELGTGPVIDPYILNPFSIGTRMCAGRRFAEQDLYVGLCRLLLKFRLEATDAASPEQVWRILLRPKTPLPIRFIPRD